MVVLDKFLFVNVCVPVRVTALLLVDSKESKSADTNTCLTVAPLEWDTADEPERALTIVNESPDTAVIKTISSLTVSGSIATANVSTLPTVRVTPPSKVTAVPVATVIDVALFDMLEARVVLVLMLEYLRVIDFP